MANALICRFIETASTDLCAHELASISCDVVLDLYRNGEIPAEQALASIAAYRDAYNIRDWTMITATLISN